MYYQLILQNQVEGLSQSTWMLRPPGVIGRDSSCQVCIDHPSISRQHCQFSLNHEESLIVKDIDSMNGIYVDDARVKQAALLPGQVLQIGALRLHIEFTTSGEPAPKPVLKPKSSVATTQPMKAIKVEKPIQPPIEKPWWKRLFG
jgi:pSer/pThr/pTyr-binding forkhead associated (FHA) protein